MKKLLVILVLLAGCKEKPIKAIKEPSFTIYMKPSPTPYNLNKVYKLGVMFNDPELKEASYSNLYAERDGKIIIVTQNEYFYNMHPVDSSLQSPLPDR